MPVHKTAAFLLRLEGLDASLQTIREFIEYIKANDPGTIQYPSVLRTEGPNYIEPALFRTSEQPP